MPKMVIKKQKRKLGSVSKAVKIRGKGYKKQFEVEDDEDFDPLMDLSDHENLEEQNTQVNKNARQNVYGSEDESQDEVDSDQELQEALLAGRLQPGLHAEVAVKPKLNINNSNALKSKLNEIRLKMDWIERLDICSNANDLPPNVPNPLKDPETELDVPTNDLDIVRNDIKRELLFTQQARASVFKAMQKLHKLKVVTRRPPDYFAEMLKTEDHMSRVVKRKEEKLAVAENRMKAKQLREQKKLSKKIQVEVIQQRHKEKREFNEKVKKLRQGKSSSTDFLDEKPKRASKRKFGDHDQEAGGPQQKKKKMNKKEYKQSKYGLGGIKRDRKKNTAESSSSFDDFRASKHSAVHQKKKGGGHGGSRMKKQNMRGRKGNK